MVHKKQLTVLTLYKRSTMDLYESRSTPDKCLKPIFFHFQTVTEETTQSQFLVFLLS